MAGEKETETGLHLHRRKKPLPEKFQRKQTRVKGKKSAAYQPRDADTTSGHDDRGRKYKEVQKAELLDQNDQKSEGAEAGEKSKSDFMQPDSTFTEEAGEEQGRKIASDDYRHRDTYHSSTEKGQVSKAGDKEPGASKAI